ncbi:MAG: hypothetical protein QRY72_00485 [Candidatus Rhabdochlamydia sp.]
MQGLEFLPTAAERFEEEEGNCQENVGAFFAPHGGPFRFECHRPLRMVNCLRILCINEDIDTVEQPKVHEKFMAHMEALHPGKIKGNQITLTHADLIARLLLVSKNMIYLYRHWEIDEVERVHIQQGYSHDFSMNELYSILRIKEDVFDDNFENELKRVVIRTFKNKYKNLAQCNEEEYGEMMENIFQEVESNVSGCKDIKMIAIYLSYHRLNLKKCNVLFAYQVDEAKYDRK